MSPALRDALRIVDGRALAVVWQWTSIDAERFRHWLRRNGHGFVDPDRAPPAARAVENTVDALVARARRRAAAVAVVSGRPVAALVAARLAQRLAIVYGIDPRSDEGRRRTWHALAVALGLDLGPEPATTRLADLPSVRFAGGLQAARASHRRLAEVAEHLRNALRPPDWPPVVDASTV